MKAFGLIGITVLVVLLVLVGPFISIWCLNTLFPSLAIPYTWDTWLATVLLGSLFTVRVKK
jgi:hypothetical protein